MERSGRRSRRSSFRRHVNWSWNTTLVPRLSTLAFGLFLFVIVLAPFPLGSNEWQWVAIWGLLIAASVPFLDYSLITAKHLRALRVLGAACAVLGLYVLSQSISGVGSLLENLIWRETRDLLDLQLPGSIAILPTQTRTVLGGVAIGVLVFFAAFVAGTDPLLARVLIITAATTGVANAVLGIILFQMDPRQLLWATFPVPRGQPSGTFVSRNNAATLFATSTVIFFVIVLKRILWMWPKAPGTLKQKLTIVMLQPPPKIFMPLMLLLAGFATTLMTLSRGGIMALFVGLLTAFALLVFRVFKARVGAVLVIATLIVALIFLSQIGLGAVGSRVAEQRLMEDGRIEVFKGIIGMIRDNPWFGIGLGNFEAVFPRYRPDTISPRLIWNYAHSTPLQLLVELGIPAGLLALAIPIGVTVLCARGALKRRRDSDLPAIGAAVGVVGLVQSVVDFSFQIPGYALVYSAILGAAAAQSFRMSDHDSGTTSLSSGGPASRT